MNTNSNPSLLQQFQVRNYNLSLDTIPRLNFNDEQVDEYLSQNLPVIITNSNIAGDALKWDLKYLQDTMGDTEFNVFESPNHVFKYYSENKVNRYNAFSGFNFTPRMRMTKMTIEEFSNKLDRWSQGDDRLYLQQELNSEISKNVRSDFLSFNWNYLFNRQAKHAWGSLSSNLLLIGMEGNVTPCHFDEQQNFFAQIKGYKRVILFPPSQFDCLYPHQACHPHDRQSQVDFENPDYSKFPKFKEAKGCEAILAPGDVLYIPVYWFHHVESVIGGGYTITVNFWFKDGRSPISYPLKDHQKIAILRNVEKMMHDVLQDPKDVGYALRSMVLGRYTEN